MSFSEERKASPEEMDLLQTKERTWRRRQQIKAFTALNDELVCIIYDPKKKKKVQNEDELIQQQPADLIQLGSKFH